MMTNDRKTSELNDQEMSGVSGGAKYGPATWKDFAYAITEAREAEEARKQAEATKQPGARAHGGGASGGW